MVSHYLPKLKACLAHLDEVQLWQKEAQVLNSIGGIVLHVVTHVNRNIVRLRDPDVCFEHAGYHIGQIVDRTQRLTGIRLQFVHNGLNEKALKLLVEKELLP